MRKLKFMTLILAILISSASSASWSGGVKTNTTGWHIERQSGTVAFDLTGSVDGEISAIEGPGGRILSPYHSYYADVDANDVMIRERTLALEGQYSSEEVVFLRSEAVNDVNLTVTKPAGGDWTITWHETWPVILSASKTIDYAGKEINNRDYAGCNLDYAGMNFLYNSEFSKDRVSNLLLERMNATVVATSENETIVSADFMPTKSLNYEIASHSTGIADLKYKQRSSKYDFKRSDYAVISEGMERYYGEYNLTQKINMKSVYIDTNTTDDTSWLGCCFGGYLDMDPNDRKWNESEVFDCTCFDVSRVAEFQ